MQGDPLAMCMYALAPMPMILCLDDKPLSLRCGMQMMQLLMAKLRK